MTDLQATLEIPHVIFNGLKYDRSVRNGEIEYVRMFSEDKRRREGETGLNKSYLRIDVWDHYFGKDTRNGRKVQYIDPNGDLTDPFNLQLKADSLVLQSRDRSSKLRQDIGDLVSGYLKICLGCHEEWRVIAGKVLIVRKGTLNLNGPCEQRHTKMKAITERWKNATEVLRSGLKIPHLNDDIVVEEENFSKW